MPGGSTMLQAALRGGSVNRETTAVFEDAFTGVQTPLDIEGGLVTVDITATNRRMLSLALPPEQSTFDLLSVPGGEIAVTQTYTYIDTTTEAVPVGVFCVTQQGMSYKPDSQLTLTCPDRWWRIQSNGFGAARTSVASNAGWQEIKRLVEAAWPNATWPFPGWATIAGVVNPDQSATTKVGPLVWTDGDRSSAIRSLLKLNSLDCYFDAAGLAVLRPIPTLIAASLPVWTINPGPSGMLKDADRIRDTGVVHNVVIVSTTASDLILAIQEVANTHDPAVDPLSSLGPLGRVTLQLSDNYRSSAQMTAAGKVQLSKELSIQQQLSVAAYPNPALDGYDVVTVVLPKGDTGTVTPSEQHLIQSVTIPFEAGADQQITLRATRNSADETI